MAVASAAASAAVVFVIVVRRAELLRVDDLDDPPLARVARHRLHHRRERAAPELLRHVVVCIYAGQLLRREVPVDEPVVLERILRCIGEPNAISFPSRRMHDSPLRTRTPLICVREDMSVSVCACARF